MNFEKTGLFVAKPLPRDQVGGPLPLIIFMAMFRVPGSIYSAWLTAVSGWAIDEDYHNSLRDGLKNAKRREASWAGLRLFFRALGKYSKRNGERASRASRASRIWKAL